MRYDCRHRGFSLLEVLVAVLVLSLGLLGLAGLQAQALQHGHTAGVRAQATQLSYEIFDSMRANRAAAAGGAYDIALDADPPAGGGVVATDLQRWKAALADRLPGGDGSISVTTAGAQLIGTVTVQWRERTTDPDDPTEAKSFTWSTAL